jgi:Leucine-rich repeat (LRR) protein
MVVTSCPGPQQWQQLLVGQLPEREADELDRHLATCSACLESLRTMQANDTLVDAVRSQAATPLPPVPEAVQRLMQRLKLSIRSQDTVASLDQPADEPAPEGHAFLAPAQGPGELGRLGSFRVLQVLGSGGMGTVFLAEDTHLQRQVALKVMLPQTAASPQARQRFLREARATAALKHDNIVTIHQVQEVGGVPSLAMELLEGETLAGRLRRDGRLPLREVLLIGREMAEGLHHAHERGLIHRDVKPANVWLEGKRGRVKILDFGLARTESGAAHLTQAGGVVGTPAYMAPEQAEGGPVDRRCDLFSLGCVLYQMSTGVAPFMRANHLKSMMAVTNETPPPPRAVCPDLPEELSALVMRLLSKDPEERPDSAAAVAEVLQTLEMKLVRPKESAATVVLGGAGATRPPAPPSRRSFTRAAAAAAIAATVLLPLGYLYGGLIWRIATNQGELVIESNDPNIEVTIKGPAATVYDKAKDRRFVLTAGAYDVEVREDGDGGLRFAAKKVTITRGGKETFVAVLNPIQTDAGNAAERILAAGGRVTVRAGDQEREVKSVKELPPEPFTVVAVNLAHSNILDDGLAHLEPLSNLTELDLTGTSVSDAGLAHLEKLSSLKKLTLEETDVRDAGLKHLLPLRNLVTLNLAETKVSDAGLEQLQKLPQLQSLKLAGTKATGSAVLALRKELTRCAFGLDERQTAQWVLSIGGKVTIVAGGPEQAVGKAADLPAGAFRVIEAASEQFTDYDLPYLQPLTSLKVLRLDKSKVTDAGLVHLQPLTNLQALLLSQTTGVTGEGLVHLKPLKNLQVLDLNYARVTAAGLATLQGLTSLEELHLSNTGRVSADALASLKPLTKLRALNLNWCRVRDADLEHLRPLTNLTRLYLQFNFVTDAGLEHLKPLTKLTMLRLGGGPNGEISDTFRDAGLVHLKSLTNLKDLALEHTQVSDAGLVHLQALTNLEHLRLVRCPLLTNEGMVHLQALLLKARPDIKIEGFPGK